MSDPSKGLLIRTDWYAEGDLPRDATHTWPITTRPLIDGLHKQLSTCTHAQFELQDDQDFVERTFANPPIAFSNAGKDKDDGWEPLNAHVVLTLLFRTSTKSSLLKPDTDNPNRRVVPLFNGDTLETRARALGPEGTLLMRQPKFHLVRRKSQDWESCAMRFPLFDLPFPWQPSSPSSNSSHSTIKAAPQSHKPVGPGSECGSGSKMGSVPSSKPKKNRLAFWRTKTPSDGSGTSSDSPKHSLTDAGPRGRSLSSKSRSDSQEFPLEPFSSYSYFHNGHEIKVRATETQSPGPPDDIGAWLEVLVQPIAVTKTDEQSATEPGTETRDEKGKGKGPMGSQAEYAAY